MPEVIVVLVKNGSQYNTAVVPFRVPVAPGNQTITWKPAGPNAAFPENAFWWKTMPPPLGGAVPQPQPDGTLTLTYDNTFFGEVWSYGISITDGTATINIDPEVDNGTPPMMYTKE